MPVVIPYVQHMLRPEVVAAVKREQPAAVLAELDSDDEQAYSRLLLTLWNRGGPLTIVEEDVIPPPGALTRLARCRSRWCAHEVWLGTNLSARTLGLVHFSSDLQRLQPDLMRRATHYWGPDRPLTRWTSLDIMIVRELEFAGYSVHIHQPPAEHLHYPRTQV